MEYERDVVRFLGAILAPQRFLRASFSLICPRTRFSTGGHPQGLLPLLLPAVVHAGEVLSALIRRGRQCSIPIAARVFAASVTVDTQQLFSSREIPAASSRPTMRHQDVSHS